MDLNFNRPLLQAKAFFWNKSKEKQKQKINTYDDDDDDDDDFIIDSHDDHLSSLDDWFAHGSQESDSYKDSCAYSRITTTTTKTHALILSRLKLYKRRMITLELIVHSNFVPWNLYVF